MLLNKKLESMLLEVLDAIIARYERNKDYPFIDTKLDLVSGRDFGESDPWYKQRGIIYPWIQGRGLEALAGHLKWLPQAKSLTASQRRRRQRKLESIIAEVADRMEKLRRLNHGRMFFMMTTDGVFVRPDGDGCAPAGRLPAEANFSDLFYAKGLFAAGAVLNHRRWQRHGENYLRRTVRAILADRFITDQQMFDPKNPVTAVPGKLLQGPKMIALDGTAWGIEHGDSAYWERRAIDLLKQLYSRYLNLDGRFAHLEICDYWEAVNPAYEPYLEDGRLLADPGHELEFIGLSLKNLLQFRSPAGLRLAQKMRCLYPAMLRHYFRIGFNPKAGGIIKSFDLIARKKLNTDMPWWSLPETIRAAALCGKFSGDYSLNEIILQCTEAFFNGYVNPDCHRMAYQTRSEKGKVIEVIPATPDADPGYHTGLSILDALPVIAEQKL